MRCATLPTIFSPRKDATSASAFSISIMEVLPLPLPNCLLRREDQRRAEIENSTKLGHGLYTVDGAGDGLEQIVVGVFSGFFPARAASMASPISAIPQRKARRYEDLASCP